MEKRKKDRYLQFASTAKNRWKFINELPHFQDFKWDLFEMLDTNEDQKILATLQKYKLPVKTCYIISFDPEIDTQTMKLPEAIKEVVNYNMGTILVFGDADIIVYGGEEVKSRYISKLTKTL